MSLKLLGFANKKYFLICFRYIYQQMFAQMGWGQVGALAEKTQDFPEYHVALQDFLKQHGINMVVKQNIRAINSNTDFSQVGTISQPIMCNFICIEMLWRRIYIVNMVCHGFILAC
jgi:hypothetical protein